MQLKLSLERAKEIPLNQYDKNFTFIINGSQYHTSRIVADLLSPTICQLHYNDPTISEFLINTEQDGNFQHILNLVNYNTNDISEDEIPFLGEILQKLNNNMIQIQLPEVSLTKDNVIDLICQYENKYIFSSHFQRAIVFISSHFYEIDDQEKKLNGFKKETIEQIIINDQLQLESEDQLLDFINELFENDPSFINLYEHVNFLNVSTSAIQKFVSIFDYNDLTSQIWKRITTRLTQEISIQNDRQNDDINHKYVSKGKPLLYESNQEFKGIFDYINKKGNIYNEISFTSSPLCTNEETDSPKHVVQFDNNKYFRSKSVENAFICFDFKNRRVIPTSYTIRSTSNNNSIRPKSWAIEGSNNNTNWDPIDVQKDSLVFNVPGSFHTFQINKQLKKEYQYIRIRQTDHGYDRNNNGQPRGDYIFVIDSIEFYGYLFE